MEGRFAPADPALAVVGRRPAQHHPGHYRPRQHHRATLALAAVVAMLGAWLVTDVGFFAIPAFAIGNGKFSIAPASSSRLGRTVFTPVLSPGVVSRDKVVVVNETTTPLKLRLYAADAFTTRSGAFALQPDFKPKRFMGKWIHLPVSTVTVAPLSGDVVPFTYHPPATVTPGDYAGGIVAEETNSEFKKSKSTVHIRAVQAVGVAVYGVVRGKLLPRLDVTDVGVSTTRPFASEFGGAVDATVTYSVTNTGNENLTPDVRVSLSPLIGTGPSVQVHLPQILPGSTVTLSHTFSGVSPFGDLTANVVAQKVGAEASGSGGAVVVPWGVLVLLVLLAAAFILLRRRRRNRPVGRHAAAKGAR